MTARKLRIRNNHDFNGDFRGGLTNDDNFENLVIVLVICRFVSMNARHADTQCDSYQNHYLTGLVTR